MNYGDMVECSCGCTWNSLIFDACPKCSGGVQIVQQRHCKNCGKPLPLGSSWAWCDECYATGGHPKSKEAPRHA